MIVPSLRAIGYDRFVDFVRPIEAIVPGARGRVLAVLANTTSELNLRTVARLAGVSQAQASRVLPGLVDLGLVERRELPPASIFRLVPEHVAVRALLALARSAESVHEEIGRLAAALPRPPVSVIVFGSFARGEAGPDSDIDVVVVRPRDVDEDDDAWSASLEAWRRDVRRLTGNVVEVLEVTVDEVAERLRSDRPVWADIRRDGRAVHGPGVDALCERPSLPEPPRTKAVSAAQVRAYAAKAAEFANAAADDLRAGRNIAATSLAVHAGINSADAVCGARLGRRAAGADHDQVLVLLRQAGPDGGEVERDLRRLLPFKSKAEYDPDDIAPAAAAKAVERAQRCVAVARRVAATTR